MQGNRAMELVYHLNAANLDTMMYLRGRSPYPLSPSRFYTEITRRGRPLRSTVRLARALDDLLGNIIMDALTFEQRNAVRRARGIVDNIYNLIEEREDILTDTVTRAVCSRL
jgi:hypothetical protein